MDDRIRFIEHHGKQILLVDASRANAHEMQLLLEHVRITVAQHARESLLTLGDLTGGTVDHAVATKMKEVLTLDRPFVKKTAWVGTESNSISRSKPLSSLTKPALAEGFFLRSEN